MAGDETGSLDAYDKHLEVSTPHPELIEAADLFRKGNVAKAERITRDVLKKDPTDVVAIRLLANIGLKVGQTADAKNLLRRCLELAPDFHTARHSYAIALFRSQDLIEALAELDILLKAEPMNPQYMKDAGLIFKLAGLDHKALRVLEKAAEWLGDDAEVQVALSELRGTPEESTGLLGSLFKKGK